MKENILFYFDYSCSLIVIILLPMELASEGNEHELMDNFEQLALERIQESASVNPSIVPLGNVAEPHREELLLKGKSRKQDSKRVQRGVEDNPQYFRVDLQLSVKLYQIYRRLKVGPYDLGGLTFQQKQQANMTMNYHKIIQMIKDAEVKLQIAQKLTLLRSIKKFSFNHNYISKEQFTKVFKVIIHGLGVKEVLFRPLVQNKYSSVVEKQSQRTLKRPFTIKLNKNFGKLKTEPAIEHIKHKSKYLERSEGSMDLHTIDQSVKHSKESPTVITGESQVSTARKPDHRKRVVTEVSRYEPPKRSYLSRALQKNKLNVVSWDSLFKMTEQSLNPNISIPSFISKDVRLDDLYF